MSHFDYINGELCAEQVPLSTVADRFGTPCYVYSRSAIEQQWRAWHEGFGATPHLICYAVKANGNLAVLNLLARLGSGFDVVSGGELQRVIRSGGDPHKTVFSGVGKTRAEMQAALKLGIRCFNVESEAELHALNETAGIMRTKAPVSIRVNPDVDAKTHPYISTGLRENKFGISINRAESVYAAAARLPHVEVVGIDCHIGSQITSLGPHQDACDRIMRLVRRLQSQGVQLRHIDVGGGLGITYHNEHPPAPAEFIDSIRSAIGDATMEILVEPGRSIVGSAGLLLTRVLYLKVNEGKHFAIVDAAMNDLIRPVLYDAWQSIRPVQQRTKAAAATYDVVGPVCESGDFLGLNRELAIAEGDLLGVGAAGAYGFAMSSNYNARPRAAEVMVHGVNVHEIRRRETIEDLYQGEHILP